MGERQYATFDNSLDQADQEALSDEALEKAAGGTTWEPMLTGVATICVGGAIAIIRRPGSSTK